MKTFKELRIEMANEVTNEPIVADELREIETLTEKQKYPAYARISAIALAAKIRALSVKINHEQDSMSAIRLVAQQNKLIGYALAMSLSAPTK